MPLRAPTSNPETCLSRRTLDSRLRGNDKKIAGEMKRPLRNVY